MWKYIAEGFAGAVPNRLSWRKILLAAAAFCRRTGQLPYSPSCRAAVEAIERLADEAGTPADLVRRDTLTIPVDDGRQAPRGRAQVCRDLV